MNTQEIQKLRDLNVELLKTNIRVWERISRFCAMHKLEIPYDPQLQYNLRQAVDIIADVNESLETTQNGTAFGNTEERDRTEPTVKILK